MNSKKPKANRLGENLKQFRKSFQLSQKDLGNLANVTQANVSQWESGKSTPPIKVLELIKTQYPKINTEWFFSEPDETRDFQENADKTKLAKMKSEIRELHQEIDRVRLVVDKQEQEIKKLRELNEVLTILVRKKLST